MQFRDARKPKRDAVLDQPGALAAVDSFKPSSGMENRAYNRMKIVINIVEFACALRDRMRSHVLDPLPNVKQEARAA